MIGTCAPIATGPGFLSGLLYSLDCHAVLIAEQSFAYLGSGGPATSILTTALTILIAIFGYRLMFGPAPDLGDATGAAIKVGIALAIATSWPAVSSVIARPVLQGPGELTSWATGTVSMPDRLARADSAIAAATSWGTGRNDIRSSRTADGDYTANAAVTVSVADDLAFGAARVSFLLTAIASIGLIKLFSGILIGLAPIFAALLFFERTRGVFAGWARALFALLIAGAAVNLVLILEMAILEPWLAELVRQRQEFLSAPSAAIELLAMTSAFGLVSAAIILLVFRLSLSLEMPASLSITEREKQTDRSSQSTVARTTDRTNASRLESERILQTSRGLERIERLRHSHSRVAEREGAGMRDVGTFISGSGSAARPVSRRGRDTLIAKRRDAKA